ncbi:MAG: hypothetical protein EA425_14745 [Puniceicoccaceae bacterium]|nr:MAG: hypothetical protein EA425_14745 [Puniceicoccaceae bacterium]
MGAIDESIVREYFEQNGFFVRQVRKYQVQSRKKSPEESIDLLVYNPRYVRGGRAPEFFLFSSELPYVHHAVLSIKGWHTAGRFNPTMLRNSPEIFRFLEENVIKKAKELFPSPEEAGMEEAPESLMKILVAPGLPTQEPFKSQSVALLKEKGVDGVISFRSILLDLIGRVEVNLNYGKSELLQILRLLKHYELLKEPQLEFSIGVDPGRRR